MDPSFDVSDVDLFGAPLRCVRAAVLLLSFAVLLGPGCAAKQKPDLKAVGPVTVRVGPIEADAFDVAANPPDAAVERTERLVDLFFQAGCAGDQLTQPRVHGRYPDVVCRLPGRGDGSIVVAAYVDPSTRDGEDWSGPAVLPQLYRALSIQAREHSYVFVGLGDSTRRDLQADIRQLEEVHEAQLQALVDVQRLRVGSSDLLFSSSDPELRQDLSAVAVALGMRNALRFVDVPDAHRHELPTIVLATPMHAGKEKKEPAVVDGREAYRNTARVIAVYLAYLDDTLRLRGQPGEQPVSTAPPPEIDPL